MTGSIGSRPRMEPKNTSATAVCAATMP